MATYKHRVNSKLQVQIALKGMDPNISSAISTHAPDSLTNVRELARRVCNVAFTPMVAQARFPTTMEATSDILVAAVQQLTAAIDSRKED
jgi:hypothetical protein